MSGNAHERTNDQGRRMLQVMQPFRSEVIAKHRWKTGRATRPIRVGRAMKRYVKVNGRYRWIKVM